MSLPFISQRERVVVTTYSRIFDRTDVPGAGFAFDCNASGKLLNMQPAAQANYQRCLDGTYDVVDRGVQVYQHSYNEPASVRCDCLATVWLEDSLYNECERCGLGINGSGQRLSQPWTWDREDQYAVFGPRNQPEDY